MIIPVATLLRSVAHCERWPLTIAKVAVSVRMVVGGFVGQGEGIRYRRHMRHRIWFCLIPST